MRLILINFLVCCSWLSAQDMITNIQFAPTVASDVQQHLTPLLQAGEISLDVLSGIYLDASMELVNEGKIDGMRTRYTAAYQLYLNLRISGSQEVISSQIIPLKGMGNSADNARRAALRSLRTGTPQVDTIVQQLQRDYQQAFGANCSNLLAKANQQAERDQLLTALAITNAIPMDASCYGEARASREEYYLAYQAASCQGHLEAARQQLALELPKAALEEIGKIDPASDCAITARKLLEDAADQMKEQQSRKAQFLRQVYQNQVQVEQARNAIISDLVKE